MSLARRSTSAGMHRPRRNRRRCCSGFRPTISTHPRWPAIPIQAILTTAPGNGEAIGGVKVITANGWFAARPSGTEEVYKLYAESFRGTEHLRRIQEEAQAILSGALGAVRR